MAIVDKNVTSILSVNDPKLMTNIPKGLIAATHAIKAYVSAAIPITDTCAEKTIYLIAKNLKEAFNNANNMGSRTQITYAQYLADMVFNNASLGYIHAMTHQLGGSTYHMAFVMQFFCHMLLDLIHKLLKKN